MPALRWDSKTYTHRPKTITLERTEGQTIPLIDHCSFLRHKSHGVEVEVGPRSGRHLRDGKSPGDGSSLGRDSALGLLLAQDGQLLAQLTFLLKTFLLSLVLRIFKRHYDRLCGRSQI